MGQQGAGDVTEPFDAVKTGAPFEQQIPFSRFAELTRLVPAVRERLDLVRPRPRHVIDAPCFPTLW
jgi:hypothetical protein